MSDRYERLLRARDEAQRNVDMTQYQVYEPVSPGFFRDGDDSDYDDGGFPEEDIFTSFDDAENQAWLSQYNEQAETQGTLSAEKNGQDSVIDPALSAHQTSEESGTPSTSSATLEGESSQEYEENPREDDMASLFGSSAEEQEVEQSTVEMATAVDATSNEQVSVQSNFEAVVSPPPAQQEHSAHSNITMASSSNGVNQGFVQQGYIQQPTVQMDLSQVGQQAALNQFGQASTLPPNFQHRGPAPSSQINRRPPQSNIQNAPPQSFRAMFENFLPTADPELRAMVANSQNRARQPGFVSYPKSTDPTKPGRIFRRGYLPVPALPGARLHQAVGAVMTPAPQAANAYNPQVASATVATAPPTTPPRNLPYFQNRGPYNHSPYSSPRANQVQAPQHTMTSSQQYSAASGASSGQNGTTSNQTPIQGYASYSNQNQMPVASGQAHNSAVADQNRSSGSVASDSAPEDENASSNKRQRLSGSPASSASSEGSDSPEDQDQEQGFQFQGYQGQGQYQGYPIRAPQPQYNMGPVQHWMQDSAQAMSAPQDNSDGSYSRVHELEAQLCDLQNVLAVKEDESKLAQIQQFEKANAREQEVLRFQAQNRQMQEHINASSKRDLENHVDLVSASVARVIAAAGHLATYSQVSMNAAFTVAKGALEGGLRDLEAAQSRLKEENKDSNLNQFIESKKRAPTRKRKAAEKSA